MRGSISSVGPDRWRIRVYAGRDPLTAKKRYVSRTITGPRGAAETAVAELVAEVNTGGHIGTAKTVGALLDRWLTHREPDLAPYTLRGYRANIERYIRPAIGALPLRKLTGERLDDLYAALRVRGGVDGRPLSARTVHHVHANIRTACQQALRWGWVSRNPADVASPPPLTSEESEPPTLAELARILHVARDQNVDLFDLARVAVVTGGRREEFCGLRWSDIDFDLGQLTIARAIVEPRPRELIVKPPKTKGSRRTIAMPANALEFLRTRRARLAEAALACGIQLGVDAYVLSGDVDGRTPLRPDLATSRWRRLATRAGVPACRLHDLRHFATTHLLGEGIDVDTARRRAGHASAKMTLDVYGHAIPAADRRAAEIIGKVIELEG